MKLRHLVKTEAVPAGRVMARFGQAALVRARDGKWLLEGGSRHDRLEAKEWISLFLHEAVVRAE